MIFNDRLSPEKRKFYHAVFVPLIVSVMMILVFVLEKGMEWDFSAGGIMPRDFTHLSGILTYVFVHADVGHLFNNVFSFILLSTCLYYFYNELAYKIMFLSYLFSGVLLWTIGRESWHIGASGWIYALAFFLFFSGLIRRHVPLIAMSLIITFLYGSMVWHIFPWKVNDPISWEGHLSGGIAGLLLSVIYRKEGPQPEEPDWDEDEDADEDAEIDAEYKDENYLSN